MLVDTFHTLPIGENPVNSNVLALTRAAGLVFLNGLMLALPIITLLLTVNCVGFTQPHGPATVGVRHWFSADADGGNFINVIANATYRPLL